MNEYTGFREPDIIIKTHIGHDKGRNRKFALSAQLEFLRRKGDDYIFAYFLHHILDYLERCYLLDNVLNRIRQKLYNPKYEPYLEIVLKFVENNLEEILKDIAVYNK